MVSHGCVHRRLRRTRGKASDHKCVSCGSQAHEWAYQNTGDTQYAKSSDGVHWDSLPYSEDLDDYAPMCRSCHRKMDETEANFARSSSPQQPYSPAHPGVQSKPLLPAHF